MIKRVIAIYPGRFQPFAPHHYKAFKWLQDQFGIDNTFVATSAKTTETDSPFTFIEKKAIIKRFGINDENIVQITNPYKCEELINKFDKQNTAVVFMLGEKDASRISLVKKDGSPSSIKKYQDTMQLRPYAIESYLIITPHISLKLPGFSEMSGTNIRKWLSRTNMDEFKRVMGWFEPILYTLMKKKLNVNENLISPKTLLLMGGAAGHMSHVIDDNQMTFNDLKTIIRRALEGKLDVEDQVTEKTDGLNLFITYKDNEIKAARNKATIKNPLDINGIKQMFNERGEILEAFSFAMTDLQNALANIDQNTLLKIFKNGQVFANIEIIYPKTGNTIDYGDNSFLQIHNLIEFDSDGNKVKEHSNGGVVLQKLIQKVNAHVQTQFTIIPPVVLGLQPVPEYEKKIQSYETEINKLQSEFGLSDSHSISEYYIRWWSKYIKFEFKIADNNIVNGIARRWSIDDKQFRLNNKTINDKNLLAKILQFEETNAKSLQQSNVDKFENLLFKISVEVLEHATNYMSASTNTNKDLKNKLAQAIKSIKNSGNIKDIDRMKRMVDKLNLTGNSSNLLPAEGLVFTYKGKQYKLTGAFSPINQILGMVKFR